jgi:DedD protein
MPLPVTDDELQLRKRARRRLVGAIVLVLLVVVFLPMALDNEPKPLSRSVDIQVPALDSAENKFPGAAPPPAMPAVQPTPPAGTGPPAALPPPASEAPPPAAAARSAGPATPPAPSVPELKPEVEKKPAVEKKPVPEPKVETTKKSEPVKKAESAKKAEPPKAPAPKIAKVEVSGPAAPLVAQGFVVQLGAFANAANAKQLYQKVRAEKVPAYLEFLKDPGGDKTRVRAGPFDTEGAADKARQKLLRTGLAKGELKIVKQGE